MKDERVFSGRRGRRSPIHGRSRGIRRKRSRGALDEIHQRKPERVWREGGGGRFSCPETGQQPSCTEDGATADVCWGCQAKCGGLAPSQRSGFRGPWSPRREPTRAGLAARKPKELQFPFSPSSPGTGLCEGVSLSLKGLVMSLLPQPPAFLVWQDCLHTRCCWELLPSPGPALGPTTCADPPASP